MRQDTDFQTLVTCSVQVKARQAVGESPGGYTDMMSTYRGMLFILNSKSGNLCQPCRVRQLLKPTDSPMEPPSALEPLFLSLIIKDFFSSKRPIGEVCFFFPSFSFCYGFVLCLRVALLFMTKDKTRLKGVLLISDSVLFWTHVLAP